MTTLDQAPANEPRASLFTREQEAELRLIKSYFPFRVVWGAVSNNGEFITGADYTRRRLNSYVRKAGWIAATIG